VEARVAAVVVVAVVAAVVVVEEVAAEEADVAREGNDSLAVRRDLFRNVYCLLWRSALEFRIKCWRCTLRPTISLVHSLNDHVMWKNSILSILLSPFCILILNHDFCLLSE
jgi:hypothetical protein